MMARQDDLIQSLCTDLRPVKPVLPATVYALAWMGFSTLYVILITAAGGPLRDGVLEQLATQPRFLLESVWGFVALAMLAVCAFRAAIPGALSKRFLAVSFLLLLIWLLNYVVGIWLPALEPSSQGERHSCWLETVLYAIGPMLIALVLVRRLYPLNPWHTTVCVGLAAGLLPALYMQLACMYLIPHVLAFHILPGLAVGLVGSLVALFFLRTDVRTEGHM